MSKKSKKGGGGKAGGRTEDERLLVRQQRAQAEEEMSKKRDELLTLFLQDKLQREERNSAVNLQKINDGWRSVLRQSRCEEQRRDLAVMQQTFEGQLDALDDITKTQQREREEAERQSAQVQRAHLQRVDSLRALQDERLTSLHRVWGGCLRQLSSNYSSDKKQMLELFRKVRAELKDATFALLQQHQRTMSEIHKVYDNSIDAMENATYNKKETVRLNSKMRLLEETSEHQQAEQRCRVESMTVEQLQHRNTQMARKTESMLKVERRLKGSVLQLKDKISAGKKEHQVVEQDLQAAADQVKQRTRQLRDQFQKSEKEARKKLTRLTVQSDTAMKKLQAAISQGERVLRVGRMCRKQESKLLLSPPSEEPGQEPDSQGPPQVGLSGPGPEPGCSSSLIGQPDVSMASPELSGVMRRINRAVLQREALKTRRGDLRAENRQLRLLLRQHLDAMTVGEQNQDQRHALLTVRPAPLTVRPAPLTVRPAPTV